LSVACDSNQDKLCCMFGGLKFEVAVPGLSQSPLLQVWHRFRDVPCSVWLINRCNCCDCHVLWHGLFVDPQNAGVSSTGWWNLMSSVPVRSLLCVPQDCPNAALLVFGDTFVNVDPRSSEPVLFGEVPFGPCFCKSCCCSSGEHGDCACGCKTSWRILHPSGSIRSLMVCAHRNCSLSLDRVRFILCATVLVRVTRLSRCTRTILVVLWKLPSKLVAIRCCSVPMKQASCAKSLA
jgi:hypothetical protein